MWLPCDVKMSIKFTNEPPAGIKAGLKRTYQNITQDLLDISNMAAWKPMLYCVSYLHTVVQVYSYLLESLSLTGKYVRSLHSAKVIKGLGHIWRTHNEVMLKAAWNVRMLVC